jgi:hypothetical protein
LGVDEELESAAGSLVGRPFGAVCRPVVGVVLESLAGVVSVSFFGSDVEELGETIEPMTEVTGMPGRMGRSSRFVLLGSVGELASLEEPDEAGDADGLSAGPRTGVVDSGLGEPPVLPTIGGIRRLDDAVGETTGMAGEPSCRWLLDGSTARGFDVAALEVVSGFPDPPGRGMVSLAADPAEPGLAVVVGVRGRIAPVPAANCAAPR